MIEVNGFQSISRDSNNYCNKGYVGAHVYNKLIIVQLNNPASGQIS